jgi:hypothetical protein
MKLFAPRLSISIKRGLYFVVAVLCVATRTLAATTPVHLEVHIGDAVNSKPPVASFRIVYCDSDGDTQLDTIALPKGQTTLDASLFRILATKKDQTEEVGITAVRISGINPKTGYASEVDLTPKATLKTDFTYRVEVGEAALPLAPGFSHDAKKDALEVNAKELSSELDYLHMRTLQNKVSFKEGEHLGAGSLLYTYRFYQPSAGDTRMRFVEATVKADVDFVSKDKSYFNSIVGQLSALELQTWKVSRSFQGAYYIGFDGSIESDKDFETIDGTGGVVFKAHVKNPITTFLHDKILDVTSTQGDTAGHLLDAGIAPLFTLGYDYLGHIKHSSDTNSGHQRAKGGFTWDLPVARNFRLPLFDSTFDADVLIDLEAIYDTDMRVFRDNSKITFDTHQRKAKEDGFAFTLSYEHGKATPTFKNVDAVLAGIKAAF